jgi:hypothetical protein
MPEYELVGIMLHRSQFRHVMRGSVAFHNGVISMCHPELGAKQSEEKRCLRLLVSESYLIRVTSL